MVTPTRWSRYTSTKVGDTAIPIVTIGCQDRA